METRKEGKFMAQGKEGQKMSHEDHAEMRVAMTKDVPQELKDCIKECVDCSAVCRDTVTHCLAMGGEHARPDHIWLMLDCAEICQTSAHFMMHNSPLHQDTCEACAEVCEACADDCEKFTDDQMMQQCAESCRRCAESCRKMAEA